MFRDLIEDLHAHFSVIACPTDEQKRLLINLTNSLVNFPAILINRDDLRSRGFDTANVDDSTMKTLVSKLSDDYFTNLGWLSIDSIAKDLGVQRNPFTCCPKHECPDIDFDNEAKEYICKCCGQRWSDAYVLLQYPEDASYFHDNDVGFPCTISQDPTARYISEHSYIEQFSSSPNENTYYKPITLPESRGFVLETFNDDCQHITDEHGIETFGLEAIWVPLSLLEAKKTIDYHNIVSATYDPFTKKWSITDNKGITLSGTFVDDDNDTLHYNENDEEWYKSLDIDNQIELVISPSDLSENSTDIHRYDGVNWYLGVQEFGWAEIFSKLREPALKIINTPLAIKNKYRKTIEETDANPDKWYELLVDEGEIEGTHTIDSGDTFEDVIADFQKYAIEYGTDNLCIDIWQNRDTSTEVMVLFDIEFDAKVIKLIVDKFREVEPYVSEEYTEQRFDTLPQLQTEELVLADFDEWFDDADLSYAKERYESVLRSRGEEV